MNEAFHSDRGRCFVGQHTEMGFRQEGCKISYDFVTWDINFRIHCWLPVKLLLDAIAKTLTGGNASKQSHVKVLAHLRHTWPSLH